MIGRIDLEIAKSLLYLIGATGHDSKRYYLFTVHLHNLARFLPASRARSDSPSTDVQAGETVSPEEAEVQGLMEAIAAEPRLCMASSYRDIFGRF